MDTRAHAREEVPLTRMLLYMLPLSWPSRSTLTLMMQESEACWLYMGREVMDTERLWWWEVRGRFGPAPPVPISPCESQMELDAEGASGEESAVVVVVEQLEDEEAKVEVEDKGEAVVEHVEQARVSCMLQEL